MKESRKELLVGLFQNYPKVDKFFVTSDDQAFFEKHCAEAHCSTLGEESIMTARRAAFEEDGGKPALIASALADAFVAALRNPVDAVEPTAPVTTGLIDPNPEAEEETQEGGETPAPGETAPEEFPVTEPAAEAAPMAEVPAPVGEPAPVATKAKSAKTKKTDSETK